MSRKRDDTPTFLHFDELSSKPIKQRIPKLLTMRSNVLVNAYRKAGKTSLMMDLMASMTSDEDFLGTLSCVKLEGPCVYMNIELEQSMLRQYAQANGIEKDNDAALFLDYCGRMSQFKLADDEWRDDFADALYDIGAAALIIDPIHPVIAMGGGDSNSNDEGRYTMELLGEIRRSAELDHLFVVDHTGHQDKTRARGASSKEDWADVLWNVQSAGDGTEGRTLTAVGRGVADHKITYQLDHGRLHTMEKDYKDGKVTAAGAVRAALISAGKALTSQEIQAATGLSSTTVSDTLNEMDHVGNVDRHPRKGQGGGYVWNIPTAGF